MNTLKGQVLECKNCECQGSTLFLLYLMVSKVWWKHFKYHDSCLWRWQQFSCKDQVLERHGKLDTKQLHKNPLRGWSNLKLIQIPVRIRKFYVKYTFHISLSIVVINMVFTKGFLTEMQKGWFFQYFRHIASNWQTKCSFPKMIFGNSRLLPLEMLMVQTHRQS